MNVALKPEYNAAMVACIPNDWKLINLGDVCKPQQWPTISSQELTPTGYPVYGANGQIGFYDSFNHENETVAVTCRGATCGSVTLVPPKAYITGNAMCLDEIDSGICCDHFLYHALVHRGFRDIITGSAQPQITGSSIRKVALTIPPLPEQQKIAAILTAVDDKLNIIGRQIEATQTLKRGLMQTLFSRGVGTQDADGRWVPHTEFINKSSLDIPAEWNVKRLGEIAPLIRRPVEINPDATYPELGLRSYGKGTFHKPALLGTEVGNKRLFEIKAGDLLFSNVFAWEGAVAVAKLEDDGRFGSHRYITCTVEKSQADTSYVFRYLTTPAGITSLTLASPGGAGRNKTLGLGALADITMPLPPLVEQQKISQILDGVDAKLQTLESKLSTFNVLKRGLTQKLLTGEWRVKLDAGAVAA